MKKTILLFSALLVMGSVSAQKLSIQERLSKLEQQPGGGSGNTADLVYQLQQLQQQLAQLQGTIEEQNHQINELKNRQKVLYVDMDSRMNYIEEAMGGKPKNELTEDSAINDDETAQTQAVTIAAPVVRPTVDGQVNTQVLDNSQVTSTSEPVETAAKSQYLLAFNELKAGRSNESSRLFEDFIQAFPNNDLTDNAYYWLGESYYVSRNYPLALAAFQNLKQKFPLSSKLSDSLLKIGYTYHELEDYAQAEQALNTVVDSFPNQPVARMAEKRLNLLRREGKLN